ncbi:MAG: hypothetical protein HYX81_00285 [Chloroflexi bacterium]|nr:hypothetical protein [Chloroflexota bacterium]
MAPDSLPHGALSVARSLRSGANNPNYTHNHRQANSASNGCSSTGGNPNDITDHNFRQTKIRRRV